MNDGEFYISNIAFYRELRGLGLGTKLMAHAERKARDCGAAAMVLETEKDNTPAIRFYKKLGFETEKEITVKIGAYKSYYRLKKNIPPL